MSIVRTEPVAIVAVLAVLTAGVTDAQDRVKLEPSVRITGRVVDAAGRPVAGVQPRIGLPEDPKQDDRWRRQYSSTDELGWFERRVPDDSPFDLSARANGIGTAYVERLRFDHAAEVGDLVLRGEGRLTGTVRFDSGEPVRGLYLGALSRRTCEATGGRVPIVLGGNGLPRMEFNVWLGCWEAYQNERDDGLLEAHVRTDDEGRFDLRGLAPGEFLLQADCFRVDSSPENQDWRATGGEPIALVADLHRVRFRFLNWDGATLESRRRIPKLHIGEPSIHRYAVLADGRRLIDASFAMNDDRGTEGPLACWLEPGSYYAWTNFEREDRPFGDVTPSEAFFEVPPDRGELTVDLTRREPAANPGRVQVRVSADPSPDFSPTMFATVRDETGRGLLVERAAAELIELPPGRYLVGAGARRNGDLAVRWEWVEVRAGEVVPVEIEWAPPGSIRLALESTASELRGDPRDAGRSESGLDWKRSVTTWVVPRYAGPAAQVLWQGSRRADSVTQRLVPPTVVESFDAFAPGLYDLVVWRDGQDPIVNPLEIKTGELTEVRVAVPEPAD